MAPNGARKFFFLLIQTSPTFWVTRILILGILIFWICLDPRFPDFQIPGFPYLQIPGSWNQLPGYGWMLLRWGEHHWTTLPDHRIQEMRAKHKTLRTPTVKGLFRELIIKATTCQCIEKCHRLLSALRPFQLLFPPHVRISRFPDFENLVRARLGPGRVGLEPSEPKIIDLPL